MNSEFSQVDIISISPCTNIPSLRFIVEALHREFNSTVVITDIFISAFNSYYNELEYVKFKSLVKYEKLSQYKNTPFFKIWKYVKIISRITSSYFKKQKTIIYSPDYQVISIAILLGKFFGNSKVKLIYHQFDLFEFDTLNGQNKHFLNYHLMHFDDVHLYVFPEENRAKYFQNLVNHKINYLTLPNSCRVSQEEKRIHKVFNDIPSTKLVVGHVGNLGGEEHYFKDVYGHIEKLEYNTEIIFLFIGRQTKYVNEMVSEKPLKNVVFVEEVKHEDLASIYPRINIGMILYKDIALNLKYCAPNKLYEYWAYGIPVVAHHLEGLKGVYNRDFQGSLIDLESFEEFKETLSSFNYLDSIKNQLKNHFEQKLNIDIFLETFINRVKSI